MKAFLISLVLVLSLVLSACGTFVTPTNESPDLPPLNPQEVPSQPAPTTTLPDSPTQGDATQMNPSLQNLIDKAKEDLAQRFSLSITQINLLEARDVTWPNSSLGCPEKGLVYADVLTPGYLVIFESGGNTFEYHSGTGGDVIYCQNPTPPVFGTPGNT